MIYLVSWTRRATHEEGCPRLEKVTDGLFEGEEAVLRVMGWVGRGLAHRRFGNGGTKRGFACLTRSQPRRTDVLEKRVRRASQWSSSARTFVCEASRRVDARSLGGGADAAR